MSEVDTQQREERYSNSHSQQNGHHERSGNTNNNNPNNNRDRGNNRKRERGNSRDNRKERKPFALETEDPRLLETQQEKTVKLAKRAGHGRNTESFDPRSTLVRPDMRVIVGSKDDLTAIKEGRLKLKHDDVLVVPNFFCAHDDWTIYNTLIQEMRENMKQGVQKAEWISWHEGAHLISQNPSQCAQFQNIQNRIADYFGIANKSVGTRFNWYRDSADWKPFHHDSAAFNPQRAQNQNITVGVSFGATRELAFLHAKTGTKIYFPQTNGMLFSFGRDVNILWKHGVNYIDEPYQAQEQLEHKNKVQDDVSIGRISIVLWGLCPHVIEEANSPPMLADNTRGNGHHMHQQRRDSSRERRGPHHNDRDHGNAPRRADSRDRQPEQRRRDDSRDRRPPPRRSRSRSPPRPQHHHQDDRHHHRDQDRRGHY